MLVEAWLRARRAQRPDRAAVNGLTYASCTSGRAPAPAALAAAGAPGDASAIALPPGAEFAVALHACCWPGAVAVPVDLRLAAAERAQVERG